MEAGHGGWVDTRCIESETGVGGLRVVDRATRVVVVHEDELEIRRGPVGGQVALLGVDKVEKSEIER